MSTDGTAKRCGLVVRVSTEEQARNPEGSLTNQLERLRAHLAYRNSLGETWMEAETYVLKAISGRDSVRSKEFAKLFEGIRAGRVNVVMATALDRLSRNLADFLGWLEELNQMGAEFICLKQQFDTTSAHGKLFLNFAMAMAQFEREQTSERNRDASLARAQRGLWNGGQILGFDLPSEGQRGTLVPNEREVAVVRAAFDLYLETGSILDTANALSSRGYRTKEYTSRRGKHHPGAKFVWATTRWLLTNQAYIGRKQVLKKRDGTTCQMVDAAWPAIVPEDTFYAVQRLLAENERTKRNQVRQIRHVYVFNHGLLSCGRCGGTMEGRSGTGRNRTRHYYYVCRNKECALRLPASEIEHVVLERIRILASEPDILTALVAETNRQLRTELPKLEEQRTHLEKERQDLQAESDGLLKSLASLDGTEGRTLVAEKLDALAERRRELQEGIAEVATATESIRRQAVDESVVRDALVHIGEVYEGLPPYRRKDLIRLVLDSAQVSETELRLGIRGRLPSLEVIKRGLPSAEPAVRSETSKWLLGLMSQSPVIFDLAGVRAVRGLWWTLKLRLAA